MSVSACARIIYAYYKTDVLVAYHALTSRYITVHVCLKVSATKIIAWSNHKDGDGLLLVSLVCRHTADLRLARDRVKIHSNRGVFGKGMCFIPLHAAFLVS